MPGINLNDTGRQQAQLLADQLVHLRIHAVYSSPMERAMQTAAPIAAGHGLVVQENEHLTEIDFGEWTNKTLSELDSQEAFQLFNQFRSSSRIPGGEIIGEVQQRMVNEIQRLTGIHKDETVVLVSHGDVIKTTLAFYAGIHPDLSHRLEISPASVSIIELYKETCRVVLINHTGSISF